MQPPRDEIWRWLVRGLAGVVKMIAELADDGPPLKPDELEAIERNCLLLRSVVDRGKSGTELSGNDRQ